MILPCSSRDIIPQKGKMGFEQRLVKGELADCESTAVIPAEGIFTDDRRQLSNSALIEYINQLNAAARGYDAFINHRIAQKGLFVGLQEAEFFDPVYAGDHLTLKGRIVDEVAQVSFVKGVIERNGTIVAELITKLYEVKDAAEFEQLTRRNHEGSPPGLENPVPNVAPAWLKGAMQRNLFAYLKNLRAGDLEIGFELALPQEFEAFDGHFPGNPILPGVVLLEIGKLGLELLLQQSADFIAFKRMKIASVVFPGQTIACFFRVELAEEKPSVSAFFKTTDGREFCRYSGYFKEGTEE